MSYAEKARVAVLRGGPSSEYHISLRTGATVLANLPEKYHPLDVFIDREGLWHLRGKMEEPHAVLGKVDLVWNALHGEYGEDGTVQHLLEAHGTPFTGPKRFAATLSQNKLLAKRASERSGIKTPYYKFLRREETPSLHATAGELYRTFPQPCIVKPASKGSSIGIFLSASQDEIAEALFEVFAIGEVALIEEYIDGREAICAIIEGFRGEEHYSLLPVEVRLPSEREFLDFRTRYEGESTHLCPGKFSAAEKAELQELAIRMHRQ